MKMRARKSILCEKATEFPCVLPLRHLPNSEKKRCKAKINAGRKVWGGAGPHLKTFIIIIIIGLLKHYFVTSNN
jgi:hypothetical protein